MKFANATNLNRKSGVAQGRDLLFHLMAKRNHGGDSPTALSLCRKVKLQVPPLRYPGFLSNLVALANLMRLSLLKAAHACVGEGSVTGIRVRSSRDDKS
jgi:hypothetical protein